MSLGMTERPWLSECAGRMIEADFCHQLGASTCTHTYVYTIVWSHRQTWIHTYTQHTKHEHGKTNNKQPFSPSMEMGRVEQKDPCCMCGLCFSLLWVPHMQNNKESKPRKKKLSSVWWEVPSCQSKLAHPRSSQELYLLCPTGLQKLLTLK